MNRLPRPLDWDPLRHQGGGTGGMHGRGWRSDWRITPPKNKYTPQQDVEIGREAAAEVRREYPIIDDRQIDSYLDGLGRRLVAAAPAELKQEVFEYSFTPVNLKDINAFALPGGPMFVNRGMFAAATTEGEVVGVMAHELSHVLLRHGTANATKAQGFQLGALAGAIAGAVDRRRSWRDHLPGFAVRSRHLAAEIQPRVREAGRPAGGADHGARGYDPRDLGRMFETIAKQGNGAPPQWLSSHPNPGNRTQYIAEEASKLQIGPRPSQAGFTSAKSRFDTAAAREVDGRRRTGGRRGRRRPRRRGPGLGGHRWPTRASARAAVPHGARWRSVPGERAHELDGGVVEQLREVRATERLWLRAWSNGADARGRTGRGPRYVTRLERGHRLAGTRLRPEQSRYAAGRGICGREDFESQRDRHTAGRPIGPWRRRACWVYTTLLGTATSSTT